MSKEVFRERTPVLTLISLSGFIGLLGACVVGADQVLKRGGVQTSDAPMLVGYFAIIMLVVFFGARAMEWAQSKGEK
ncbi:MAG: hypothetical protein GC152_00745 [Alphaproteobacteria bacterium]|nr:hypothetical protein [Alphaproteobacteria bacterium]